MPNVSNFFSGPTYFTNDFKSFKSFNRSDIYDFWHVIEDKNGSTPSALIFEPLRGRGGCLEAVEAVFSEVSLTVRPVEAADAVKALLRRRAELSLLKINPTRSLVE